MKVLNSAARRLLIQGLVVTAVASLPIFGSARPSAARQPEPPSWAPTGLAEPVFRLFTPSSGAFFALTEDRLMRSDDGGSAWHAVPLPPDVGAGGRPVVTVDSKNHSALFAGAPDRLYKSGNGGATWDSLSLPAASTPTSGHGSTDARSRIPRVEISPADPNLLYLLGGRFARSRDGGSSWEPLPAFAGGPSCLPILAWLEPHPTDPGRAFRAGGCHRPPVAFAEVFDQSRDQGGTWSGLTPSARVGLWRELAGGYGASPSRFYLSFEQPFFSSEITPEYLRPPPSGEPERMRPAAVLLRTDDDGAIWNEIWVFENEEGADPVAPRARISGLTVDQSNPDTVYLAVNEYQGRYIPFEQRVHLAGRVLASPDGGTNWTDLTQESLGEIRDLALGIDGLNLYAASDRGVWRLGLR